MASEVAFKMFRAVKSGNLDDVDWFLKVMEATVYGDAIPTAVICNAVREILDEVAPDWTQRELSGPSSAAPPLSSSLPSNEAPPSPGSATEP